MSVRQASGEGPLHLATSYGRAVSLTRAQLSMLLEGIHWRSLMRTWTPELAV